jgi:serine/threonine protein kinase
VEEPSLPAAGAAFGDQSSDRNPVEELAEEFMARYRRGERPSLQEYTDRYPAWAEQIRALFPALVVMEKVRPAPEDAAGPAPGPRRVAAPLERLGDYRILREVGRGGMGVVFEAEQESLGRHVALKVLPAQELRDPRHLQRFKREARAAARLHHTNIVPVHGVGEEEGLHYYVMQFIQGQGLDQVLTELRLLRQARTVQAAGPASAGSAAAVARSLLTGQLVAASPPKAGAASSPAVPAVPEERGEATQYLAPEGERESGSASPTSVHLPGQSDGSSLSETGRQYWHSVARIGLQVADALSHASSQGVLHRDIKPSNLLLDTRGTVWVTDFGLAKADTDRDNVTHTGDIVGTLRYMAPERFQGQADVRSDVYALGLTLYELLTLRPAFNEADRNKLIAQVMHDLPPRPRSLGPTIPRDLETIVLKAIAREPAQRYQTPAELAEDLQRFLDDRPIRARRMGALQRGWRWCRRNPVLACVSTGLVLVLLGGSTGVGWQWLRAERHARDAEAKRQETHEAVREYFTRVSENKLLGRPGLQGLRKDLLESALRYFREFLDERGDDPQMRAEVAATHVRVAMILDQTGSKEEAQRAFQDALALYQQMIDASPSDPSAAGGLARTYNQLGELYSRMSALDQALDSLNRSRAILDKLTKDQPLEREFQSELARAHRHIAGTQARKGLRTAALGSLEEAAAIGRELVQSDPDRADYLMDLSATYNAVGELHVAALRWKEALPAFEKARDLLEPLARGRPTDIDLQSKLADNQAKVANAYNRNGRLAEAVPLWQEVRTMRERLAYENPAVVDFQWELAVAYCFLGKNYSQQKELAEALACWQQAFPVVEKLLRINPNFPDYRLRLADLHNDNAHVYSKMGRQADALRSFEQARPILEDLVRDCPDTATYRHALAINRHNNGNELRQIGRRPEARQSLERGLELCLELIAKDESFLGYPFLLVHVHNQLGLLHQDAKELDQAADRYRQALEVCLKLHRAQPQMALYEQLLGSCHANLGSAARAAKKLDEAEGHYREAHAIREKLVREHAELTDVIREAAEASRDLADLLRETGKTKEALALFEQARDHAKRAFQASPLDLRAQSVEGEAWDGIGLLLAPMGRRDEAIQAHRRAIELQKTAVTKEPEQLVYRERLEKHVKNLARLYHDLGRPDDADAVLRELKRKKTVKP